MRNVSDKSCREKRNTFYVQHVFTKIILFKRSRGKIRYSKTCHGWK